MVLQDSSQTFVFTFRDNGTANGRPLAEVLAQQLHGNDPSVAPDAYKGSWFGTEEALRAMAVEIGFDLLIVEGVTASLHGHHDCDRKLSVTPAQLQNAGFRPLSSTTSS